MKLQQRFHFPAAARQRLNRACARPVALVAGDDALRSSIALLLTAAGMTVGTHRSIRTYLAGEPSEYGCLIVDYRSGDPSTGDLFMNLVQRGERIPIIAMTSAPEMLAAAAAAYPDLQVIGKPFDSDLLIKAVRASQEPQLDCEELEPPPNDAFAEMS